MLLVQLILLAGFIYCPRCVGTAIGAGCSGYSEVWMLDPIGPSFAYLTLRLSLATGGGAAFTLLRWFRKKDGKFFAYYLMHDYAYGAAQFKRRQPDTELEHAHVGRIWQTQIAQRARQTDVDEVLVVGHSSGAHLGGLCAG